MVKLDNFATTIRNSLRLENFVGIPQEELTRISCARLTATGFKFARPSEESSFELSGTGRPTTKDIVGASPFCSFFFSALLFLYWRIGHHPKSILLCLSYDSAYFIVLCQIDTSGSRVRLTRTSRPGDNHGSTFFSSITMLWIFSAIFFTSSEILKYWVKSSGLGTTKFCSSSFFCANSKYDRNR